MDAVPQDTVAMSMDVVHFQAYHTVNLALLPHIFAHLVLAMVVVIIPWLVESDIVTLLATKQPPLLSPS